jgi:hypothetical protein
MNMEDIFTQGEKVYQFKNYRNIPNDSRSTSKNQRKKCEIGLHEFMESPFEGINEDGFSYKKWACKHCGLFMDSR